MESLVAAIRLNGGWWRVVGLLVAYLFVMQASLAIVAATQAAAGGTTSDSIFVICSGHSESTDAPASDHAAHESCCLTCTLAAVANFTVPTTPDVPAWVAIAAASGPFPMGDALGPIPREQTRSGLTRAPPQDA
jgi:hypothetical protein